jgi:hypothetical protein
MPENYFMGKSMQDMTGEKLQSSNNALAADQ